MDAAQQWYILNDPTLKEPVMEGMKRPAIPVGSLTPAQVPMEEPPKRGAGRPPDLTKRPIPVQVPPGGSKHVTVAQAQAEAGKAAERIQAIQRGRAAFHEIIQCIGISNLSWWEQEGLWREAEDHLATWRAHVSPVPAGGDQPCSEQEAEAMDRELVGFGENSHLHWADTSVKWQQWLLDKIRRQYRYLTSARVQRRWARLEQDGAGQE